MSKSLTYEMDEAYVLYESGLLFPEAEHYDGFKAGWEAAKADSHNHKMVVEYDLAPAAVEGKLRDKLIEMGWTPPNE